MAKPSSKHFPTGSTVRYTTKFMRSIGMHKGAVDGLVLGMSGDRVLVAWSDGRTSMVAPATLEKAPRQPTYDTKSAVTAERVRAREELDPQIWTQAEIEGIIDGFQRDDMTQKEAIAAEWSERQRPEVVRRYRSYLAKVAPLRPSGDDQDDDLDELRENLKRL